MASTSEERLRAQLTFLHEIDALKGVLRQSMIVDGSRRENTAEHSWHLAMMVDVLAEHALEPIDRGRVVRLQLVHDIVEIDAGDTFLYDEAATMDKAAREQRAADRLFGLLPADQGQELRALWDEFEARQTPEAVFARAVDRLQPIMLNRATEGHTWRANAVRRSQVERMNAPLREGAPALWAVVEGWLDDAVARGWLLAD